MNGSVNLDKRTGKYSIKLYLEGKQVCICTDKYTGTSFTSKAHALKALGAIQLEIDEGVFKRDEWRKGTAVQRKTVRLYANVWLDHRIKMAVDGVLVASTVIDNHTNVNKYILPRFGKRPLSSITTKDILELKASIDRSPSGVCNVLCTFQKLLNDAAAEGLIGTAIPILFPSEPS